MYAAISVLVFFKLGLLLAEFLTATGRLRINTTTKLTRSPYTEPEIGKYGELDLAAGLDAGQVQGYHGSVLNQKDLNQPRRRVRLRPRDRPRTGRPYPSDVTTGAERRRWDLAERMAVRVAQDIGGDQQTVWLATRSLYNSDSPTDA